MLCFLLTFYFILVHFIYYSPDILMSRAAADSRDTPKIISRGRHKFRLIGSSQSFTEGSKKKKKIKKKVSKNVTKFICFFFFQYNANEIPVRVSILPIRQSIFF